MCLMHNCIGRTKSVENPLYVKAGKLATLDSRYCWCLAGAVMFRLVSDRHEVPVAGLGPISHRITVLYIATTLRLSIYCGGSERKIRAHKQQILKSGTRRCLNKMERLEPFLKRKTSKSFAATTVVLTKLEFVQSFYLENEAPLKALFMRSNSNQEAVQLVNRHKQVSERRKLQQDNFLADRWLFP